MPRRGWLVNGEKVSDDEVLAEVHQHGSFHKFPLPAWEMLMRQTRREGGYTLSPSAALRCPRNGLLKATEDYWLIPEKTWPMLRGTAWHRMMEGSRDSVTERRLRLDLPVPLSEGVTVTIPLIGTPDNYYIPLRLLDDFKTVGKWERYDPVTKAKVRKTYPEPEHVAQVNLYALLLAEHDHPVEKAQLWYFQDADAVPRRVVPVPLWGVEDTYQTAMELAEPLARTKHTGLLPPCRCAYPGYGMHANLCATVADADWRRLPDVHQ